MEQGCILAATGWLELGLPDGALEELRRLPKAAQNQTPALDLTLRAHMDARDWNAAADTARLLCTRHPELPGYFIHAAYCLHETGDTLAARNQLLSGPKTLLDDPLFHYNLACYHWTLGERERARDHLDRAITMDPSFRETALADRDLSGISLS